MLSTNTSLHKLDLSSNNMVDGAVEIAKMLATNTTLRVSFLNCNKIGYERAIEISKILYSNYSLTNVDLGYSIQTLNEILERNKKITENGRFVRTKSTYI